MFPLILEVALAFPLHRLQKEAPRFLCVSGKAAWAFTRPPRIRPRAASSRVLGTRAWESGKWKAHPLLVNGRIEMCDTLANRLWWNWRWSFLRSLIEMLPVWGKCNGTVSPELGGHIAECSPVGFLWLPDVLNPTAWWAKCPFRLRSLISRFPSLSGSCGVLCLRLSFLRLEIVLQLRCIIVNLPVKISWGLFVIAALHRARGEALTVPPLYLQFWSLRFCSFVTV